MAYDRKTKLCSDQYTDPLFCFILILSLTRGEKKRIFRHFFESISILLIKNKFCVIYDREIARGPRNKCAERKGRKRERETDKGKKTLS